MGATRCFRFVGVRCFSIRIATVFAREREGGQREVRSARDDREFGGKQKLQQKLRAGQASQPRSVPFLRFSPLIFAIAALVAAAAEPAIADNAIHLKRLWIGTERQQVFGVARRGKELWSIGSFGVMLQKAGAASWNTVLPPLDEV